jgi:hypothetical protein
VSFLRPSLLICCAVLAWVCLTVRRSNGQEGGPLQKNSSKTVYVGFIEDDRRQLDHRDSKDPVPVTNRILTPAFQKDDSQWKPVVSLSHRTKWTVAFDGRRLGEVESEASQQDPSQKVIGPAHIHSILTPVNQLPSVGKPDGRFNGNFGTVVRRPLVVVSEPHFSDPDHWAPRQASPRAMTEVRKSFRETFRHVRQCDPSGEALKEDWKIPDSEIVVSKSYGSKKGEYLVETKVLHNKCLFSADGDDFQSLGGNQVFYVPPGRDGVFLGLQWEMVDAGDYDGDGKSEVIFYVAEGKDVDVVTEGYVLFYDGFRHSVRFVWENH